MNNGVKEQAERIYEHVRQLNFEQLEMWQRYVVFSWRWWFQVCMCFVLWGVWLLIMKKDSRARLLYVGFFVSLVSSWLDFVGVSYGLWGYPYQIFPTLPSYLPYDVCLLPVMVMIFLQIKPKFSPWIKAFIFAAITAFGAESLFEKLGMYEPNNWKPIYSFPIYGVIYLVSHLISKSTHFAPLLEGDRKQTKE